MAYDSWFFEDHSNPPSLWWIQKHALIRSGMTEAEAETQLYKDALIRSGMTETEADARILAEDAARREWEDEEARSTKYLVVSAYECAPATCSRSQPPAVGDIVYCEDGGELKIVRVEGTTLFCSEQSLVEVAPPQG